MQVHVSLTSEIQASASLTEMEEQIQAAGKPPMRQAMKQAVRQWEDQHQSCPHGGEKQPRLEGTVRRTIATTARRGARSPPAFSLPEVWAALVPRYAVVRPAGGGNQ
jgi:ATP sulfurylase